METLLSKIHTFRSKKIEASALVDSNRLQPISFTQENIERENTPPKAGRNCVPNSIFRKWNRPQPISLLYHISWNNSNRD